MIHCSSELYYFFTVSGFVKLLHIDAPSVLY